MTTRSYIAGVVSMVINAVVFGLGAIAVLSIPSLRTDAAIWLPAVVVVAFLVAPVLAWFMAPRLRLRYWRRHPRGERGTADKMLSNLS
ncbi:MAG: hypothetical protein KDJ37_06010 [Hyphomicrobiaceae bacterium]|nr:hypothetical protein [Hyphomicrobiaceae bacterium]